MLVQAATPAVTLSVSRGGGGRGISGAGETPPGLGAEVSESLTCARCGLTRRSPWRILEPRRSFGIISVIVIFVI